MNIRFTSSLTPEDENMIAPALLKAVGSLLDLLPIAYAIRIDTADSQVYQHRSSGNALNDEPQRARAAALSAGLGLR